MQELNITVSEVFDVLLNGIYSTYGPLA